jgi:hypothetical protein
MSDIKMQLAEERQAVETISTLLSVGQFNGQAAFEIIKAQNYLKRLHGTITGKLQEWEASEQAQKGTVDHEPKSVDSSSNEKANTGKVKLVKRRR